MARVDGVATRAPAAGPTNHSLVKKKRSMATAAASVTSATWSPRARSAGRPTTAPSSAPAAMPTGRSTIGEISWSELSLATTNAGKPTAAP